MLRPVWLLPPKRLSTPRSGQGDLSPRLGPATRRSDAYRDGTSTRWVCAAEPAAQGSGLLAFVTHHGGNIWHVVAAAQDEGAAPGRARSAGAAERLDHVPLEQHPPVPVVERNPHDLPLRQPPIDPDLPGDLPDAMPSSA